MTNFGKSNKNLPVLRSMLNMLPSRQDSLGTTVEDVIYSLDVEIKCQLDATEVFIADLITCSTCFGHHYAHHQELKSIMQWLLPVVFRAVVFKLLVWCGAEGYVSGLQDAGFPSAPHQTSNLKTTARNTTSSNHRIILLSS